MEIYDAVANGAVLEENQQPPRYMDFISAFLESNPKKEAAEKKEKHATEMLMVKRKTEHRELQTDSGTEAFCARCKELSSGRNVNVREESGAGIPMLILTHEQMKDRGEGGGVTRASELMTIKKSVHLRYEPSLTSGPSPSSWVVAVALGRSRKLSERLRWKHKILAQGRAYLFLRAEL